MGHIIYDDERMASDTSFLVGSRYGKDLMRANILKLEGLSDEVKEAIAQIKI